MKYKAVLWILIILLQSCKGLDGKVSLTGNLIGFGIPIVFIWFIVSGVKSHQNKSANLKIIYDEAMKGNDVTTILQAGRNYYNHINKPSKRNDYNTDNEVRIQNDLKANGK
jgi:hypothetical protein